MFASSCTEENSSNTLTDIDGNVYHTVKIGTQTWMVENLKTTKYNDGTSITFVSDSSDWAALATSGYCFYNNVAANKSTYGALYNWYTVNSGKLAPTGWHIPTDAEWSTLENYLIANGYNYDGTTTENRIAKSLAASAGWITSTNIGAIGNDLTQNNSTGFVGLTAGIRSNNGVFMSISKFGVWWSTSETEWSQYALYRLLSYKNCNLGRYVDFKQYGFSVRCVMDY